MTPAGAPGASGGARARRSPAGAPGGAGGRLRLAIGLDVGGTKIAGGVVAADGRVLDRALVPTPPVDDEAATVDAMGRVVERLRAGHPTVEAIGVGAAGLVEWPAGRLVWAPHNAYRRLPLRRLLGERTGLPTVVDNDAKAATWAEARFGAGAGCDHVVLLTIGTGIGGGLLLGGAAYRGSNGFGGEVGHMVVDPNGSPCSCGNRGCLEAMASGGALGRLGRQAATADPAGRLAELAGGPGLVTGVTVFEAARQGDATAVELFERVGFWLGVGIGSLVTVFDPQVVVIGGGLVTSGDLLLGPARASYRRHVLGRAHRVLPPVLPARLGTDAGMVGAATLALCGPGG
jgi:glucokinase